ncbi:MAG: DEAD/DEAH box helicase family protein [Armatimonadetes bacterium]|nr:DEAD/DEAH box helicase family protein [Armatimonadota bacterium]
MKIKFASNQQHQIDAINAVVDLFEGQPLAQSAYEIRFDESVGLAQWSELGLGNRLVLSEEAIHASLLEVQRRNDIPPCDALDGLNFSVEMETGTGKTYVYLRTVYELNARYGFKKFVIVVPSVAIREGVMSNIDLTREHFQGLYGNQPIDAWIYDSKQVSRLRQFATSNQMQLLIINIDAFNKKDIAVIHQENDRMSGRRPIEFVQAARPVAILDEPQNMETDTAREAIASLNPLCTLRYSATHRNLYNQVYKLDPVKAYDLRLVKQIEVDSVVDSSDHNQPYIRVQSVATRPSGPPVAKLELDALTTDGVKRKTVAVNRKGQDLFDLSGGRDSYRGYVLENVNARAGLEFVQFSNGVRLAKGESQGSHRDEAMRIQIEQTIENHFEKELAISALPEGQQMKVLSLFFIDRVANYKGDNPKIRDWFIRAYESISSRPQFATLNPRPADQVHDGYFAQDAKGVARDTTGKTKADDDAYTLIMKDKERLLSVETPLRFIFTHSALREGWDNPNVFQICTLNETRSDMKKRQEIGRGMRLPVRVNGERCFDPAINRLTVIANESYREFAVSLQKEIEDECGVQFDSGRIKNKRHREKVRLKKQRLLDPCFVELWDRIKHKTRYTVNFATPALIADAAKLLKEQPPIEKPSFSIQIAEARITREGVGTTLVSVDEQQMKDYTVSIPDMLSYLQRETELTRSTIAEILIRSGRLGEVANNPQQFMDQALKCIKTKLHDLMVDGIKYERIANAEYEMMLFEDNELESYLDNLLRVDHSIYDYVIYDSITERDFAEALDRRRDIKLFFKLPAWFTVKTPLGTYNPDWAIVKENETRLYLVRETKGSLEEVDRRHSENMKIRCGKKHFDELGVDFNCVRTAEQV